MGIVQWAKERTKNLSMWDISLLKLYCAIFGIVVGAYISDFVKQYVYIFIIAFVLLGIGLAYKFLKK